MSRHNRENPDVPIEHDWMGGAAQILRSNLDACDAPTPEAVEAAMRYAKDEPLKKGDLKLIGLDENDNRYMVGMDAAAYILAAEVERLRARVAELEGKQ